MVSEFHCSGISSARRPADRRARLLEHFGLFSAFGEQLSVSTRQYALESREQIGRSSNEPGIRLRGLLIEAANPAPSIRTPRRANREGHARIETWTYTASSKIDRTA